MPSKNEAEMLGMPIGTATNRLRKSLLFFLVKRLGENVCYRCKKLIETDEEFSIEHKEAWRLAGDPVASFFAMENIAFSHRSCNCAAAFQPNKKYKDRKEGQQARDRRHQATRVASRKAWRVRRREMGLPYT